MSEVPHNSNDTPTKTEISRRVRKGAWWNLALFGGVVVVSGAAGYSHDQAATVAADCVVPVAMAGAIVGSGRAVLDSYGLAREAGVLDSTNRIVFRPNVDGGVITSGVAPLIASMGSGWLGDVLSPERLTLLGAGDNAALLGAGVAATTVGVVMEGAAQWGLRSLQTALNTQIDNASRVAIENIPPES